MVAIVEVGDGYVKFMRDGLIVAEVYALASPNVWRCRTTKDHDFHEKEKAIEHAKQYLVDNEIC
jgi:hypothetical protein